MKFGTGNKKSISLRPAHDRYVWFALVGALGVVAGCLSQKLPSLPGLSNPEPIQWIDVHVHPIGGRGATADYGSVVRAAISVMEESGIVRMVLMPPPQIPGSRAPFDFEEFFPALKSYGSRFAFLGGGGSLNPMIQEADRNHSVSDALRARFEKRAVEILQAGAAGFGEISPHHLSLVSDHPYYSVPADHPLLLALADITARHEAVIDFHFDLVAQDINAPGWLASPPNPTVFKNNLVGFERLLAHNRRAKIVWAHAGSDMFGHWTVSLSRKLLGQNANLYMSLRLAPGRAPQNHPLTAEGQVKPEWLMLLNEFPSRFVIGGDQMFVSPTVQQGPGTFFAQRAGPVRQRTRIFLAALPHNLARQIARDNATQIYRLKDQGGLP